MSASFFLYFLKSPAVALRGSQRLAPQGDGYKQNVILRRELLLRRTSKDDGWCLFLHQRIHVFDRVGKILFEFLHDGAGRFDTVDQADALSDEIADEIAGRGIA